MKGFVPLGENLGAPRFLPKPVPLGERDGNSVLFLDVESSARASLLKNE